MHSNNINVKHSNSKISLNNKLLYMVTNSMKEYCKSNNKINKLKKKNSSNMQKNIVEEKLQKIQLNLKKKY